MSNLTTIVPRRSQSRSPRMKYLWSRTEKLPKKQLGMVLVTKGLPRVMKSQRNQRNLKRQSRLRKQTNQTNRSLMMTRMIVTMMMRSPARMMKKRRLQTILKIHRRNLTRESRIRNSLTNHQIAKMTEQLLTLPSLAMTRSSLLLSETLTTMSASSPPGLELRPSPQPSCADSKWSG